MDENRILTTTPTIPGIGIAGQVMCPFSLMAPKMCLKNGCESWVELKCGDTFVGRCTFSWLTVLSVEIRQSIDKLIDTLNALSSNKETNKEINNNLKEL